jgi:uncharacterized protein YukE
MTWQEIDAALSAGNPGSLLAAAESIAAGAEALVAVIGDLQTVTAGVTNEAIWKGQSQQAFRATSATIQETMRAVAEPLPRYQELIANSGAALETAIANMAQVRAWGAQATQARYEAEVANWRANATVTVAAGGVAAPPPAEPADSSAYAEIEEAMNEMAREVAAQLVAVYQGAIAGLGGGEGAVGGESVRMGDGSSGAEILSLNPGGADAAGLEGGAEVAGLEGGGAEVAGLEDGGAEVAGLEDGGAELAGLDGGDAAGANLAAFSLAGGGADTALPPAPDFGDAGGGEFGATGGLADLNGALGGLSGDSAFRSMATDLGSLPAAPDFSGTAGAGLSTGAGFPFLPLTGGGLTGGLTGTATSGGLTDGRRSFATLPELPDAPEFSSSPWVPVGSSSSSSNGGVFIPPPLPDRPPLAGISGLGVPGGIGGSSGLVPADPTVIAPGGGPGGPVDGFGPQAAEDASRRAGALFPGLGSESAVSSSSSASSSAGGMPFMPMMGGVGGIGGGPSDPPNKSRGPVAGRGPGGSVPFLGGLGAGDARRQRDRSREYWVMEDRTGGGNEDQISPRVVRAGAIDEVYQAHVLSPAEAAQLEIAEEATNSKRATDTGRQATSQ